ncbi:exodeoxyribonuclease III [bacterium]|nr:exodeoxyribonuclease III [bacterium]
MKVTNKVKIFSWNLNGIRAAVKNGFLDWLEQTRPDVLLLQEVRCANEDLQSDWIAPLDYKSFWMPAQKKGYSGVAIYSRLPVEREAVAYGLGAEEFDSEGRFLGVTIGKLFVVSAYFPNSQRDTLRLPYKLDFCRVFFDFLEKKRKQGFEVVVGGDFNIAHTPLDLANPKQNEKNAGYLPEERAWMSEFIRHGYVDTFRMFQTDGGHYTWWSQRPGIRERNIGWRLDYHFITPDLVENVLSAGIHAEVKGSDHCPISLELKVP